MGRVQRATMIWVDSYIGKFQLEKNCLEITGKAIGVLVRYNVLLSHILSTNINPLISSWNHLEEIFRNVVRIKCNLITFFLVVLWSGLMLSEDICYDTEWENPSG